MDADDMMNSNDAGSLNNTNGAAGTDSIMKQQRQLKVDQQRFQRKAQEQLQKQNQLITDLTKSNAQLREELTKADTSTFNAKEQDRLGKVQAEVDQLEMKIQYERMRRDDVKSKHNMSRIEIMSTRRNMGGVNITSENTQAVEKQMKVLENRLDQALVKFNEALAHNKKLRADIDSLREERLVFQRIYKKLELELHEKKKAMAEKIEKANLDYEERDQLKQEIEARRATSEEDRKLCQESFLQLDKVLEQLKQTSQEQKRQQLQAMTLKQQQKDASNNNDTTKSDPFLSHNNTVSRGGNNTITSRSGGRNLNGTNRGALMSRDGDSRGGEGMMDEEERDLQLVVDDLKAMTGHQDLRLLLENFMKSEEQNFSMYHYLNSLNSQQEELEKEIAGLKGQLQGESGNADRRAVLKKLENELASCELQQDRLTSDTARQLQGLSQIRELTADLFVLSGADRVAAIKELGTDVPTDLKLRDFLGFLEQRVNELLFVYSRGAAASASNAAAAASAARDELGDDISDAEHENSMRHEAAAASHYKANAANPNATSKFIGVGPSSQPTAVTANKVIKSVALPSTNAGDGGDNAEDAAAAAGKEEILSHDEMRQRVEQRMQRRIDREERNNTKKGKKVAGGTKTR